LLLRGANRRRHGGSYYDMTGCVVYGMVAG
jgi:hypothetical protein